MPLTLTDVARIARLARLHLEHNQAASLETELNQMMGLIEQLQAVDTTGVEPLAHPLSALNEVELRLREDQALPLNAPAERDRLMQNAPMRADGLFLVPRVIE